MMTPKSRLKHSQQLIATNMCLHLPSHQQPQKPSTNKQEDGLVCSGNSELIKIWLKIWVSTGRTTSISNIIIDKRIPSTPAESDLMDITAHITLSLILANENSGTLFVRDTENSPAPFSKGLVKKKLFKRSTSIST
jgi:hypothetical protein